MKITRFTIKSLYGFFDYDVILYKDITFIYGENGSGKTTVLGMLDHILSGEIYKLFKYDFKSMTVYYSEEDCDSTIDKSKKIEIKVEVGRKYGSRRIDINYGGRTNTIRRDREYDRKLEDRTEFKRKFFVDYPLAKEIRDNFNYIFIPLNRLYYQGKYLDSRERSFYRHRVMRANSELVNDNGDMRGVEALIMKSVADINWRVDKLNSIFRQKILKSSLEICNDITLSRHFDEEELTHTKSQYIKLLKNLKTINSEIQEEIYSKYFDSLIKKVQSDLSCYSEAKVPLKDNIGGPYNELVKIKKLIGIYEEMEGKIDKLKEPILKFLKYANNFIGNGKDNKQLSIYSSGTTFFTTNYSPDAIELRHLSSGEKQIVTLLSNLIFREHQDKNAIFIVDEPELSLHLRWQKQFVETIRQINPNMQLIFATHSPEIVGRYRNKVFELQKYYKFVDGDKVEQGLEKIDADETVFGIDNDA